MGIEGTSAAWHACISLSHFWNVSDSCPAMLTTEVAKSLQETFWSIAPINSCEILDKTVWVESLPHENVNFKGIIIQLNSFI